MAIFLDMPDSEAAVYVGIRHPVSAPMSVAVGHSLPDISIPVALLEGQLHASVYRVGSFPYSSVFTGESGEDPPPPRLLSKRAPIERRYNPVKDVRSYGSNITAAIAAFDGDLSFESPLSSMGRRENETLHVTSRGRVLPLGAYAWYADETNSSLWYQTAAPLNVAPWRYVQTWPYWPTYFPYQDEGGVWHDVPLGNLVGSVSYTDLMAEDLAVMDRNYGLITAPFLNLLRAHQINGISAPTLPDYTGDVFFGTTDGFNASGSSNHQLFFDSEGALEKISFDFISKQFFPSQSVQLGLRGTVELIYRFERGHFFPNASSYIPHRAGRLVVTRRVTCTVLHSLGNRLFNSYLSDAHRAYSEGLPLDDGPMFGWLRGDTVSIQSVSMSGPTDAITLARPSSSYSIGTLDPLEQRQAALEAEVRLGMHELRGFSFPTVMDAFSDAVDILKTNHLQTIQHLKDVQSLVPDATGVTSRLGDLYKWYGDKNRSRLLAGFLDEATSEWLRVTFGILPTLRSFGEILARLDDLGMGLRDLIGHHVLRGEKTFRLRPGSFGFQNVDLRVHTTSYISYDWGSFFSGIAGLRSVGLLPNLSGNWDLIPFSFAINWFTNLGKRFDLIDTWASILTLRWKHSVYTYKIIATLTSTELEQLGLSASVSPVRLQAFVREVSKLIPSPSSGSKLGDISGSSPRPDLFTLGSLLWTII